MFRMCSDPGTSKNHDCQRSSKDKVENNNLSSHELIPMKVRSIFEQSWSVASSSFECRDLLNSSSASQSSNMNVYPNISTKENPPNHKGESSKSKFPNLMNKNAENVSQPNEQKNPGEPSYAQVYLKI